MSNLRIKHPTKQLTGNITLPASKSICNRVLLLQKVLGVNTQIQNISTADDSVIMQFALQQNNGTVDVKNAGTCMRFLTAYYAATPNIDIVLKGSERMHNRPIGALYDALTTLGADIDYIDKIGFAPLRIKGKKLHGGVVAVDASLSSQFVSALMLVAPNFKNGLSIRLGKNTVSKSYITLTADLLEQFGVDVNVHDDDVEIKPYQNQTAPDTFFIEPDWSAAAFWYQLLALAKEGYITLNKLTPNSTQGDAIIANYMERFGISTQYNSRGALLTKNNNYLENACYDMLNYPDMVPAMAVLMCALNIPCTFINVAHLEAKESKRLTALCTELGKCGFDITQNGNKLQINKIIEGNLIKPTSFNTYQDHRMAMALAPLALFFDEVVINDSEVVEKSYPHFWDDLHQVGFEITVE
jgi:3-phosphoshikimate 1-carboxyvinyltransferase